MKFKEISEREYLDFHQTNESLSVFHRPEWLNAVSKAYAVPFKYLGGFENNSLVLSFPIYLRKGYGFLRMAGSPLPQLATPITTVALGPGGITKDAIVDGIKEWQEAEKISYFQMTFSEDTAWQSKDPKVQQEVVDNLEISLEKPLEDIWTYLKRTTHVPDGVKKAVKSGVKVHWLSREKAVEEYARLLKSTYDQRQKIQPNFGVKLYENLIENLYDNGLKLFAATHEGSVVSILWILYDQQKCYYWDAASDQIISRKFDVNRLLHWEVIRWAKERNFKTYDLVGRAKHSGRSGLRPGIAHFKKTLGAQTVNYLIVKMSPPWVRMGIQCYRKLLAIKNNPILRKQEDG